MTSPLEPPSSPSISFAAGKKLAAASGWLGLARYGNLIIQIVVTAILARLLSPEEFGILAMVVIFTGFLNVMAEGGLNATLVQESDPGEKEISTFFWLSVFISAVLFGLAALSAPLLERFFRVPGLSRIVIALAIGFLFIGMAAVGAGRARREFRFHTIAVTEILASLLSGTIAILMALNHQGVWALVMQTVAYQFFRAILLMVFDRWRPILVFDLETVRRAIRLSRWITGGMVISYWGTNSDRLLIGRFLGPESLGFYSQASRLLILPSQLVSQVISPAVQPVFRSIDRNADAFRTYRTLVETVAYLSFTGGVLSLILSREIVLSIWGPGWEPSIRLFRILAPLVIVQPVASISSHVLLARNQAPVMFRLAVLNSAVYVAAIIAGLPWGTAGIAMGYTLGYCAVAFPLGVGATLRCLDARVIAFVGSLARPAIAALALTPLLFVVKLYIPASEYRWGLVAGVAATAVILLLALVVFRRDLFLKTLSMVRAR